MTSQKKEVNPRVMPNSDVLPFFGQKIKNSEKPASKRTIVTEKSLAKAFEKYLGHLKGERLPF